MTTHRGIPVHANIDTFTWLNPETNQVGRFRPRGSVVLVGDEATYRKNAREWTDDSGGMVAARIFVGFNVGPRPRWEMDDLVDLVERVRLEQGAKPDATFLAQRGLYTGDDGKRVDEKGAQLILLNIEGVPEKTFVHQIEELADVITHEMEQERVIVEIQKGGIAQQTFSWVPTRPRVRKRA